MSFADDLHIRFLRDRLGAPIFADVFVQLYTWDEHLQLADRLISGDLEPSLYWPCVAGVLTLARFSSGGGEPEWWTGPAARRHEVARRLIRIIRERLDAKSRDDLWIALSVMPKPFWEDFNLLAVEVFAATTPVHVYETSGKMEPFSAELSAHYRLSCPETLNITVSYVVRPTPRVLGSGHLNIPSLAATMLRAPLIVSLAGKHELDPENLAYAVHLHLFVALMHLRVGRRIPAVGITSDVLAKVAHGSARQSQVTWALEFLARTCRLRKACGQVCLKLSSSNHSHSNARTTTEITP